MKPRIVTKQGKPHQVVISYADYVELLELRQRYLSTRDPIPHQAEIPAEVTRKILYGESSVRAWRIYRGMSQVELAAKTRLSSCLLSLIENNKRAGSKESLRSIAEALSIPLEYLTS